MAIDMALYHAGPMQNPTRTFIDSLFDISIPSLVIRTIINTNCEEAKRKTFSVFTLVLIIPIRLASLLFKVDPEYFFGPLTHEAQSGVTI